jgi:hypothetical protein
MTQSSSVGEPELLTRCGRARDPPKEYRRSPKVAEGAGDSGSGVPPLKEGNEFGLQSFRKVPASLAASLGIPATADFVLLQPEKKTAEIEMDVTQIAVTIPLHRPLQWIEEVNFIWLFFLRRLQ